MRIPPLAVGIGMYLPMDTTQPVIVGAITGWLYDRAVSKRENAEMAKRFGVLLASGFIVGESLPRHFQRRSHRRHGKRTPIAVVGRRRNIALRRVVRRVVHQLRLGLAAPRTQIFRHPSPDAQLVS